MSAATYTIRYRSALHADSVTLIVADAAGGLHTLSCRPDHCRLMPMNATDSPTPDLLGMGWRRVPEAAPYTLEALRSLMTGALFTHHLPPLLDQPATDQP